ncbi:hypothetical protein [Bradyrhizobium genosp. P]|uniref:hypothetical protein n=1 Tax=Bradyrhizobium genosp. P TaxID=83641 RepID=UPI003CE7C586
MQAEALPHGVVIRPAFFEDELIMVRTGLTFFVVAAGFLALMSLPDPEASQHSLRRASDNPGLSIISHWHW